MGTVLLAFTLSALGWAKTEPTVIICQKYCFAAADRINPDDSELSFKEKRAISGHLHAEIQDWITTQGLAPLMWLAPNYHFGFLTLNVRKDPEGERAVEQFLRQFKREIQWFELNCEYLLDPTSKELLHKFSH